MMGRHKHDQARPTDARSAVELGLAGLLGPLGGIVANVVFARTLGASGRGDLAAIIAAMAVCEAILAFGLPDVLARHIAKDTLLPGVQRRLVVGAVLASVIPALLVSIYCHVWHFSWPVAVAAGLVVPLTTATAVARGVLVGRNAYRNLTAALMVGGIFRFAAPLTLLIVPHPTENLGLLAVLSWTVAAAIPIFWSRPFPRPAATIRRASPVLRESLGVWPAQMAWLLNARLDQLVLAAVISPTDLGRYAVCVGIAEAPGFLASGPRQILLARAAKTHSLREIPPIAMAITLVAAIGGVGTASLADPVLAAVFGPEFRGTAPVLGILLGAAGFDIAAGLLNSGLVAVGRGRSATFNQVAGLLITAVVLPIVIHLGGGILEAAAVKCTATAFACLLARADVWRYGRSSRVLDAPESATKLREG